MHATAHHRKKVPSHLVGCSNARLGNYSFFLPILSQLPLQSAGCGALLVIGTVACCRRGRRTRPLRPKGSRPPIEKGQGDLASAGTRNNYRSLCCYVGRGDGCLTMTSLHRHGAQEAHKQLQLRLKKNGLTTVKVSVTRKSARLNVKFSGSDAEVEKARQVLANWT